MTLELYSKFKQFYQLTAALELHQGTLGRNSRPCFRSNQPSRTPNKNIFSLGHLKDMTVQFHREGIIPDSTGVAIKVSLSLIYEI